MPEVNYFWDEIEDNVIEEYDENGNTLVKYTTEPSLYGPTWVQDRGGQVRHYHYDGQGNTTELTDEAGNVTDTRKYSAFGEVTESTGTTEFSYEWGGKWGYTLATSFVSIRLRMCQPSAGRWLSVDPDALITGDFGYAFASNQPAILIDPSGLQAIQFQAPGLPKAGQGIFGACDIYLILGHYIPGKVLSGQKQVDKLQREDSLDPCTGNFLGYAGCYSKSIMANKTLPPEIWVEGLKRVPKTCNCPTMVDSVDTMVTKVNDLVQRLCFNRLFARDDLTPCKPQCGYDFMWCDTIRIHYICHRDAYNLLNLGLCPKKSELPPPLPKQIRDKCPVFGKNDLGYKERVETVTCNNMQLIPE